jgi:hypothetical protein
LVQLTGFLNTPSILNKTPNNIIYIYMYALHGRFLQRFLVIKGNKKKKEKQFKVVQIQRPRYLLRGQM